MKYSLILPEASGTLGIPLSFGDPLFLGNSVSEETATNEDVVLSARRVVDLHAYFLHSFGVSAVSVLCQLDGQLLSKAGGKTSEHGGTTSHNDILEEFDNVYHFHLLQRFVHHLGDSLHCPSGTFRAEKHFCCLESFVADTDSLSVGQLVFFIDDCGLVSKLLFSHGVQGNVAHIFLYFSDSLEISGRVESVTTLLEQLGEVLCNVTACKVESHDGGLDDPSMDHGDNVRHTIT